MEIRLHRDFEAFRDLAMPVLQADPIRNTVAITVLAVSTELTLMLSAHEDGELVGVAQQTTSWPMIVSALPARCVNAVADRLVDHDTKPSGVSGPRPEAEAFADAWEARTDVRRDLAMDMRLFALEALTPPDVPGAGRLATLDDVDLLTAWRVDFATEALPADWPRPTTDGVARNLRSGQGNILWEVDGTPVSVASASVPIAGMSRVGPVWTPPEHRNHGYGSAATAAVSRWALDAGAEHVVLFTDLTNPVSNAIYPRIGYRPRFDAVEYAFRP